MIPLIIHEAHRGRSFRRYLRTWRRSSRRLRTAALVLSWAVLPLAAARAQKAAPTEYEVKAAYLYNFGRFIAWPNTTASPERAPFTFCVLGQDPFGPALDTILAGESIDGANTAAARISKPQEAVNCRILFISASQEGQLKQILTVLQGTSVLTVSDLPEFSERGGMVQFVREGKRVRFEVNLTPVEHAHLAFSSQLLKVAVNLRRSDRVGD